MRVSTGYKVVVLKGRNAEEKEKGKVFFTFPFFQNRRGFIK